MKDLISIIIPLHNEEENVPPLVDTLRETLKDHQLTYELILVDDGSQDKTFGEIKRKATEDNRVKGIRFRRNYGQTVAITAGFDLAQGDICITMDGDMQHDPEEIPKFIEKIKEGYDLVCGFRAKRNDAFLRRFPSRIANTIAKKFSGLGLRDFGSTYRAYRTSVIKEVPIYGEMHRFIPIFVGMNTDRITEMPISLNPRLHGKSKYGLARTFKVLSDLILVLFFSSFFTRPIHIFGYISLILAIPGFLILSWLSMGKILGDLKIFDYGPLFILGIMLCLVAVQLFTTGIVCEYLVRIYYMDDSRKPYRVAETTFGKPNQ